MFVQTINKKIGIAYSIGLLSVVFLCSCNKSEIANNVPLANEDETGKQFFTEKQELAEWSNNSEEIVKTRKMGDFVFTLKQVTSDMMALQELQGEISNEAKYNEAKSHYTDLFYFKLNIQNEKCQSELLKYQLETPEQYKERIKYCSFELNKDVILVSGKDTIPCALHEFERTFNIQSGLNFLVTFKRTDAPNGFSVVLHDQLFKQGLIKFNYKTNPNELPYLKIK